jgi:hypothetical protein
MDNLQTLLKEMTYIEEVNEKLGREKEEDAEKLKQTQEKLITCQEIIEQLEIKVDHQDKQLSKLTQQVKNTLYYYFNLNLREIEQPVLVPLIKKPFPNLRKCMKILL